MTKDDIKKAKSENAERIANIAYSGGGHIGQDDLETAFENGAEWRINKMWHNTSEEPEVGKHCLLEVESIEDGDRYIDYISSVWSIYGWTEDYLQFIERRSDGQYKITRWAYTEDLIPTED